MNRVIYCMPHDCSFITNNKKRYVTSILNSDHIVRYLQDLYRTSISFGIYDEYLFDSGIIINLLPGDKEFLVTYSRYAGIIDELSLNSIIEISKLNNDIVRPMTPTSLRLLLGNEIPLSYDGIKRTINNCDTSRELLRNSGKNSVLLLAEFPMIPGILIGIDNDSISVYSHHNFTRFTDPDFMSPFLLGVWIRAFGLV